MADVLPTTLRPVFDHAQSRSHKLGCRHARTSEYCAQSHSLDGQRRDKRMPQGFAEDRSEFALAHTDLPTSVPLHGSQWLWKSAPNPRTTLVRPDTCPARWAVRSRLSGVLSLYLCGNRQARADSDSANSDTSTCRRPNPSDRIFESSDAACVASRQSRCSGTCSGDSPESICRGQREAALPHQQLRRSKRPSLRRMKPPRKAGQERTEAASKHSTHCLHRFDSSALQHALTITGEYGTNSCWLSRNLYDAYFNDAYRKEVLRIYAHPLGAAVHCSSGNIFEIVSA